MKARKRDSRRKKQGTQKTKPINEKGSLDERERGRKKLGTHETKPLTKKGSLD